MWTQSVSCKGSLWRPEKRCPAKSDDWHIHCALAVLIRVKKLTGSRAISLDDWLRCAADMIIVLFYNTVQIIYALFTLTSGITIARFACEWDSGKAFRHDWVAFFVFCSTILLDTVTLIKHPMVKREHSSEQSGQQISTLALARSES